MYVHPNIILSDRTKEQNHFVGGKKENRQLNAIYEIDRYTHKLASRCCIPARVFLSSISFIGLATPLFSWKNGEKMALLMNDNADSYCLQWKFQHSILMIDFQSPVMMALYFQILANSELDIELYGKAIYMHYEFRGGEGRAGGGEGCSHFVVWLHYQQN